MPPPETIKVLKPFAAEISEQFEHGLIGQTCVRPVEPWMAGGFDPILDDLVKFVGGHAGMCGHHDFDEAFFTGGGEALHVAGEDGFERFGVVPLGVLEARRFYTVEGKEELEIERLLTPEGAVVVEDGDAIFGFDKIGGAVFGDLGDESGDC